MQLAKLISVTKPTIEVDGRTLTPEEFIVYCARVSNPSNQSNMATSEQLLRYLIEKKHWSPFETVSATIEINTSRAIAPQILRHRSFTFQEFSQRYQAVDESGLCIYAARRQDSKNRQSSHDDLSDAVKAEWEMRQQENWKTSFGHYAWALEQGIAKECARMVLPLATKTRMYMTGSLRSWIHYLQIRLEHSTQKEHRDIALSCFAALTPFFPNVMEAALMPRWYPDILSDSY
jgi:thymidylate synthase (FAD)